ncbi:nucleoporin Nup61 [Schizosaccharomyces cryophilus OY26]|uniref:Nucleoporin Nup61 n=1 Tax=Schizosaccharomyces cryophilus (strain OY26 / ATCC MYA-4695 / CBS 11777 / NBRC 106824 / NRRL Y48691) TaxID=653667 RepID=S9WYU5_SCHCR|nr:nucleoporin Nup61 [Schizosaccharomyces cryophilus OY26]EPY49852.1 nucleoporin Nup61 [Schizosaccharomyces cryophilus OY26]
MSVFTKREFDLCQIVKMSKRGADHQITKDQDESDDDRSGSVELATEASADVIASRKIAKPKTRKRPAGMSQQAGLFSGLAKPEAAKSVASPFTFGKPTNVASSTDKYDTLLKKRGLNKAFLGSVQKSLENDPFGNLSVLMEEYKKHLFSIESSVSSADKDKLQNEAVKPSSEAESVKSSQMDSSKSPKDNEVKPSETTSTKPSESTLPVPGAPRFGFSAPDLSKSFQFNPSSLTPTGPLAAFNKEISKPDEEKKLPFGSEAQTKNPFSFGQKPSFTPTFSFQKTSQEQQEKKPSTNLSTENKEEEDAEKKGFNFSWDPSKPIKFEAPEKKFTFTNPLSAKKPTPTPEVNPPSAASIGFSFGTNPNPFSFAAKSPASVNNEAGSDKKNEEEQQSETVEDDKEEDKKIEERQDSSLAISKGQGEENEDSIFETRAKLYLFNSTTKSYTDIGLGPLKLNVDRTTNAARLLARVDGNGKLLLNVRLCKDFEYKMAGEKALTVPAASEDGKALVTYLVRVKEKNTAEQLVKNLNEKKGLL